MSDKNLEEESIISQDDIDNLLESSFFEETEEITRTMELSGRDEPGEPEESDELGELSQADIDSLLGGNDLMEQGISQNLLDTLGNGGSDAWDEGDMQLISQEDMDQFMNPSEGSSPPPEQEAIAPGNSDPDDLDDADELITLDDIQTLMDATRGKKAEFPDPSLEREGKEALSDPLDVPIDDSEALDVSQCLVTQDTIDELIRNAPESLDDFEALLDSAADDADGDHDDAEFDMRPGREGDEVSQNEIDSLLQNSEAGEDFLEEEGDDFLISQDDIDTLLMAADQEDEDILGNILGDEMDAGLEDAVDGDDLPGPGRDAEILPKEDHVVLERGDHGEMDKQISQGPVKRWYQSKLVIAAASALLVLGISVPTLYFLFFSHDPSPPPESLFIPLVTEEPAKELLVTQEEMAASAPVNSKNPGNMVLADFILLASELSEDMAYVTVDISIDYSDQRAYDEIIHNLSFYRDLIYESIQKNLVWERRNEVTEADLVKEVETMLKQALPPDSIEKIRFQSFKAS